jgi:tRNA threonylcarbamoyladenosine biosynthesis protein TsaB
MPSRAAERQTRMTLVLAFDCAVTGLGVAVVRDGTCLAVRREEGREQAATLLPAIKAVLAEAGVERRELSLIAATVGPGSFTGVRVGLAAARGLAVGLGVPLAGIATTRLLLAQAPPTDRLVVAAIDSRLDDWFVATADAPDAPFVASTEQLIAQLKGRRSVIVGAQVPGLPEATLHPALPDPVVLAGLALRDGVDRWRERNRSQGMPRPLYLRGVNITLPDGARRTVDG